MIQDAVMLEISNNTFDSNKAQIILQNSLASRRIP